LPNCTTEKLHKTVANIITKQTRNYVFCYDPLEENSKQKFVFIDYLSEKKHWRVSTQLDKSFPKTWFMKSHESLEEKTKIPGILRIDRRSKVAIVDNLTSAINLSRYLLPMRSDQLKISLRKYDTDDKYFAESQMWLCLMPSHTTFRFPRKWRGVSGHRLERLTGVDGVIHCTSSGEAVITSGMVESYKLSKSAYKQIYTEILESAFSTVRINVLVMSEYLSHWQKALYEYEEKHKVPENLEARIAVFPTKNTVSASQFLDVKWILKSIPSKSFQTNFCQTTSHQENFKTTRYIVPIAFRGKSLSSCLEEFSSVARFFEGQIVDTENIRFDVSGLVAVAESLEDAESLARILIKYDAFFNILSL